jgi:hemerythrin superfamily protein
MPEGANAATELNLEHAEIELLTVRIADLEPSTERTSLVREAGARFLAHAEAEERYLYPALRRYLPEGEAEAVEQARRQQAVARIVESIERADEFDATFEALVTQLVIDVQRHIGRQESVLLPALIDACPLEEINQLGRQLRHGLRAARDDKGV